MSFVYIHINELYLAKEREREREIHSHVYKDHQWTVRLGVIFILSTYLRVSICESLYRLFKNPGAGEAKQG